MQAHTYIHTHCEDHTQPSRPYELSTVSNVNCDSLLIDVIEFVLKLPTKLAQTALVNQEHTITYHQATSQLPLQTPKQGPNNILKTMQKTKVCRCRFMTCFLLASVSSDCPEFFPHMYHLITLHWSCVQWKWDDGGFPGKCQRNSHHPFAGNGNTWYDWGWTHLALFCAKNLYQYLQNCW